MTTARDMIQDALEKMGAYGAGQTMSAADSARGLTVLNDMIDSWSNESLSVYAWQQYSFPLVVNQSAYTIGPGGQFNGIRPLRILEGPGYSYVVDNNGEKYFMRAVSLSDWNITSCSPETSTLPDTIFYDPQYPLGIINIYPSPSIQYQLHFTAWLQLVEFASLFGTVNLPAGYVKAIKDNLAIELFPYFMSGDPSQTMYAIAAKSKGNIKRTNLKSVIARYDPELSTKASRYNIYTNAYGTGGGV